MTTSGRPTTSITATVGTDSAPSPSAPSSHNRSGRLAAPYKPDAPPLQLRHATLTAKNWATYDYSTGTSAVTVSAPAGLTDANVREVFWPDDAIPEVDDQMCLTWDATSASVQGQPIQPGLAMRIASVGANNQGIKAITLTENIWYSGIWVFNVHVWDTTDALQPLRLVGSFDLSSIVGKLRKDTTGDWNADLVPPPWHLCGRTLGGSFSFKVWTGDKPEPSWNDTRQVFSVLLPPGFDQAGYSGGYIGHLHAGQSATADLDRSAAAD